MPECVPSGVLHTPGNVAQTLSHAGKKRGTPWHTFTENPLTARVSGVPQIAQVAAQGGTVGVPRLEKSRHSPAFLLAALLTRYQRGHVDQAEAAKLLGIRKSDFADLAAYRSMETWAWSYYLDRFNYAFPECDRRAVMRQSIGNSAFKARTYTDTELLTPPKRELRNGDPW